MINNVVVVRAMMSSSIFVAAAALQLLLCGSCPRPSGVSIVPSIDCTRTHGVVRTRGFEAWTDRHCIDIEILGGPDVVTNNGMDGPHYFFPSPAASTYQNKEKLKDDNTQVAHVLLRLHMHIYLSLLRGRHHVNLVAEGLRFAGVGRARALREAGHAERLILFRRRRRSSKGKNALERIIVW